MIHKVIITGPVGSGKTTAVNSLGDGKAISTDTNVSDKATRRRKKQTTVAMDYAISTLNNGDAVHLYGTPGQDRFDFMWDILSQGAQGIILLLDNSRKYPKRDLKHYTSTFAKLIQKTRLVIGITRFDISQKYNPHDYRHWIDELNITADIMLVDTRKKKAVKRLINHLILTDENLFGQFTDKKETNTMMSNVPIKSDLYAIKESTFQAILDLKGVNSLSHLDPYGEILYSTMKDEEMGNLIAFITGLTPTIEEHMKKGEIDKIMLRSPKNDNLSLFIEEGSAFSVTSERKLSITALSQQVEDILQWEE